MIEFYPFVINALRIKLLLVIFMAVMVLVDQIKTIRFLENIRINLSAIDLLMYVVAPITIVLHICIMRLGKLYDRQRMLPEAKLELSDHAAPPAIAECVWWLVLPLNRESIRIELEDEFCQWVSTMGVKRARRRYRLEVLRVAVPLAMQFIRRRFGGALEALGKRVSGKSQVSGD